MKYCATYKFEKNCLHIGCTLIEIFNFSHNFPLVYMHISHHQIARTNCAECNLQGKTVRVVQTKLVYRWEASFVSSGLYNWQCIRYNKIK